MERLDRGVYFSDLFLLFALIPVLDLSQPTTCSPLLWPIRRQVAPESPHFLLSTAVE